MKPLQRQRWRDRAVIIAICTLLIALSILDHYDLVQSWH